LTVLRRIAILVVLAAVAAVPLASAQESGDTTPTITGGEPGTTTTGTTPAPDGTIAAGVTIYGVDVGGMTAADAQAAVQSAFDEPLRFAWKKRKWWAEPERLGGKIYVAGAVNRALTAPAGSDVSVVVSIKGAALDDYIAYLNRNFARPAKNSTLRLVNLRPKISKARHGTDVREPDMRKAIIKALKHGDRGPLKLAATVIEPTVTLADFGPVIVIRRESKALYLYRGQRFWKKFGVATGQPSYPTPTGNFAIVTMQRNPWWYPPPDSEWAKDEKPVPPGPTNPLGTRWMGLSAPLVGIHGTPNAWSIGYSASHGCIRMLIPDAEWLFVLVEVGTPVFIRAV
jgi:lipoprotein-anchoring transpeptidase ErfK/SrfK